MTRGRRSLLAVLQRTTAAEVAARCGVTKQAVSWWSSGIKNPSEANRLKLEQIYGIARGTWGASPVLPLGRNP